MSLSPAIEKFFKTISTFFSDLWDWLSSIFDEGKKPAYFVNASYWLKVGKRVTTLLNEAYDVLDISFFSEKNNRDPIYYEKVNRMLERLSAFAGGKDRDLETKDILIDEEDTDLFEAFKKIQEAHSILSLVAEMNIEGLDKVYPSDEEKPQDWVTFEKLFNDIRKKTKIKREIFKPFLIDDEGNLLAEDNAGYQFVIFGSNPDGRCIDYCLNMWDRRQTIEKMVQCLSNPGILESRRKYLKRLILDFFIENSMDTELKRLRGERNKLLRTNHEKFGNYKKHLLEQYKFKFTSDQLLDEQVSLKKIYVWVKDGALYFIFRNEDEKIIRKNIAEIYTASHYEAYYDYSSECIKLLEKEGGYFRDAGSKVGKFVKNFVKEDELLSDKNLRTISQIESNIKLLYESILDRAKFLTDYASDKNFAEFVQNNLSDKKWWLSNFLVAAFFSAMPKEAKGLQVWIPTPNNKLQRDVRGGESNDRLHFLLNRCHASRVVEIGDFEQLATGKRYENRFKLCQTAEEYEYYMDTWVRLSPTKRM